MIVKMKKIFITICLILIGINYANAQSLGRVGAATDTTTPCTRSTVLMGGGTDVDAAIKWMINRSGGGDFVVVRATGTKIVRLHHRPANGQCQLGRATHLHDF